MNLWKIGGLVRGHQFSTFPNMVWQGVVFGSILGKVGPSQKLIRHLCKIDGPAKGHHFTNFSQHGLARDGLGANFWKSDAKEKTLT
jgi:hypothetical protein